MTTITSKLSITTFAAGFCLLFASSSTTAHTALGNNMYDWPTDAYYNMAVPIIPNHTQSVRMKTILHNHCRVGPGLCDCLTQHINQQGLYSHAATMLAFTMKNSGCTLPEFYSH